MSPPLISSCSVLHDLTLTVLLSVRATGDRLRAVDEFGVQSRSRRASHDVTDAKPTSQHTARSKKFVLKYLNINEITIVFASHRLEVGCFPFLAS